MLIKRISPLTKKENEQEIPVTEEQLKAYYQGGMLIQHAMPQLTPAQREFVKTGYTAEEWAAMMGSSI